MTLKIIDYKAKRRDRLIILMEIVSIARKGTAKTHIMLKANLSFTQLNEYIDFLLHHDLLYKTFDCDKIIYKPTQKGFEFLEKQQDIISMLAEQSYMSPVKVTSF